MTEKFYIAGFKFHGGVLKATKGELDVGDVVTLVPDPNNAYDENAIEVRHDGEMIGFVPKAVNQKILPMLGSSTATLSRVDEEAALSEPWKAVQVQVTHEPEEA